MNKSKFFTKFLNIYKRNVLKNVPVQQNVFGLLGTIKLQMFHKIGVLKKFSKFTEKHLHWSLSFNKVAGLRPATLLKRDSTTGVFLWILRNF